MLTPPSIIVLIIIDYLRLLSEYNVLNAGLASSKTILISQGLYCHQYLMIYVLPFACKCAILPIIIQVKIVWSTNHERSNTVRVTIHRGIPIFYRMATFVAQIDTSAVCPASSR